MSGMTGAQAAERILRSNGITDVQVRHVSGNLTDHYDPRDNVIRLSQDVYDKDSVAAVGVAMHEAGHAVGLEDKYLGKGAPNPLYPHNLMSVPDPMRKNEPLNLKRDQIQEIFTSPNNVYFEYE